MDNYNGFAATYQPMYQPNWYYQPSQTTPVYSQRNWQQQNTAVPSYQQSQQPMNNSNIIWVQGEAGAKAQNVPNGCNMAFFDSENQCIYIKSVDASGKPSLTILDYKDRNDSDQQEENSVEYATKKQIDGLSEQFSSMSEKLDALGEYVTKDQFDSLNNHLNDLSSQIEDIENRITSFGKPQLSNSNNRRGNK